MPPPQQVCRCRSARRPPPGRRRARPAGAAAARRCRAPRAPAPATARCCRSAAAPPRPAAQPPGCPPSARLHRQECQQLWLNCFSVNHPMPPWSHLTTVPHGRVHAQQAMVCSAPGVWIVAVCINHPTCRDEHIAQPLEGAPAGGQLLVQARPRHLQLLVQLPQARVQAAGPPVRLLRRRLAPQALQLRLHLRRVGGGSDSGFGAAWGVDRLARGPPGCRPAVQLCWVLLDHSAVFRTCCDRCPTRRTIVQQHGASSQDCDANRIYSREHTEPHHPCRAALQQEGLLERRVDLDSRDAILRRQPLSDRAALLRACRRWSLRLIHMPVSLLLHVKLRFPCAAISSESRAHLIALPHMCPADCAPHLWLSGRLGEAMPTRPMQLTPPR